MNRKFIIKDDGTYSKEDLTKIEQLKKIFIDKYTLKPSPKRIVEFHRMGLSIDKIAYRTNWKKEDINFVIKFMEKTMKKHGLNSKMK